MASAPTYAELAARFTWLATPSTDDRATLASIASEHWDDLHPSVWTPTARRTKAAMLLTAHEWSLELEARKSKGEAGRIRGKSAGGWSKSMGGSDGSTGQEWFGLTSYGRQFLALRRQVVLPIIGV